MTDAEFQVDANFTTAGGTGKNGYDFNDRHGRTTSSGAPSQTHFISATKAIARTGGSFLTDGVKGGEMITITGSSLNDGTYRVRAVTGSGVLLDVSESLVDEFSVVGVTYTATTAGPEILDRGRSI